VIQIAENIQIQFLNFLQEKLGMESFQMWIDGQLQIFCGEGTDTLYITAELPFVLNWYRQFFLPTFQEAAESLIPNFRGKLQICSREEARAALDSKSGQKSGQKSDRKSDRKSKQRSIQIPEISPDSEIPSSVMPEMQISAESAVSSRSVKKKTGNRSAKRETRTQRQQVPCSQMVPKSTASLSTAERLKLRKQNSAEILHNVRQADLQEVLAFLTSDDSRRDTVSNTKNTSDKKNASNTKNADGSACVTGAGSSETGRAGTKRKKGDRAAVSKNEAKSPTQRKTGNTVSGKTETAKKDGKVRSGKCSRNTSRVSESTPKRQETGSKNTVSIATMDDFFLQMEEMYADGTMPRFSGFSVLSAASECTHSKLKNETPPNPEPARTAQPAAQPASERDGKTEVSTESLTATVRTLHPGGSRLQTLMANVMKFSTEEDVRQQTVRQKAPQSGPSVKNVPPFGMNTAQTPQSVQPRKLNFSTFVMGASNRLAYTLARDITRTPGILSPALISGKTGVGKSHLLEAISHSALASGFHVVYRTAEEFVNEFVASLRDAGKKNDFRNTYRQCDVLLLDNLQFLLNKKGSLSELQNIFYHRIRQGKQIVFAADRPLEELEELGLEICSNLRGGYSAVLNEPSYDVLLQLLDSETARRDLPLAESARQALAAQHTGGDVRQIFGILNSLEMRLRTQLDLTQHVTSTERNRKELVQELMEDLVHHQGKRISIDTIKRYVAARFEIEVGLLSSGLRTRKVSQPRMLAMWLARKFTRKPLAEICQAFGCVSHTTVISAQKKVEEWRLRDFQLQTGTSLSNVNELLRQLEGQLQRTV